MHSAVFISLIASAALSVAAPVTESKRGLDCPGTGAYYVCAKNSFRGYCSSDPCDKTWCSDYEANTCTKKWTPPPQTPECSGTGRYYTCSNNGFRGYCSSDPCDRAWCPDFEVGTCTKKWTPPVAAKKYYLCSVNGFNGQCSVDPCALKWCPDYQEKTYTPIIARDDTICASGTGYFQSCGAWRGCCTRDACSGPNKWCPTYKFGTFEPVTGSSDGSTDGAWSGKTETGTCAPDTGYYQVCSNGFKGCCRKDACALGYCPV